MKYLHEINGRYAVRVVVPPELRGVVGRRELREWLGRDQRAAERAAHGVVAGFLGQLDAAKAQIAADAPTIQSAARQHYAAELAHDDRERAAGGAQGAKELRALTAPHYASLLRLVAAGQITGEHAEALIGYAADALAGTLPAGLDRPSLLKGLASVQLDAMTAFEERDAGKIALSSPTSPLLTEEAPTAEPTEAVRKRGKGRALSSMLSDFHKERTAGTRTLSEKTMDEHKVAVRMLEEYLGEGTPAASITKKDMLGYKRALMDTPTNYRLRFPDMTLPEAIEANAARSEPYATLNPATINDKWLSHISTIMGWCANNGLLEDNPARGVKVDEGKGFKEPSRVGFNRDDLKRIFGHEMFADPTKYETRQWALLVALFTGARSSSEIARIKLTDIFEEQGVWVFNLEEATKNRRSKRIVPVHQKLIDLGLLRYVEKLREAGKARLFPDWQPEDKVNRWFLRTFMPAIGITDDRKVFHSFRHSLKTALAQYGVNRDVSDLITGHKDQSVGGIYIGDASVTMITAMAEGLGRVDFKLPI